MDDRLHTLNDMDGLEVARSFLCDPSELDKELPVEKGDFTLITQNINSIYCNFDDFLLTLANFTFDTDIVILTECRLNENKPLPQLQSYLSYYTKNQLNQNDGVAIYIKNNLKHKVKEVKLTHASCLQVDILDTVVLGIYRSPSNKNAEPFINSLSSHLATFDSRNRVVITGDININIKLRETESSQNIRNRASYLNMLASYGILAGHTLVTRETTCLDHMMLKIDKKKVTASIAILETSTTDHKSVLLCISKIKKRSQLNSTKTVINFENAVLHLKNCNIEELLSYNDPTTLIDILISKISECLEQNTTVVPIPRSKRIIKPWITPGILKCIKNRNKLQLKTKANPHNIIDKITYTRYRNYCNNLIKKLKRNYERELLTKSLKNNKLLWKNIKKITYNSKTNSNNSELLNIQSSNNASVDFINKYFSSIGQQLALHIQNSSVTDFVHDVPSKLNSFVLLPTDCDEVNTILMNLKTDSAVGWDNIPTSFLKLARNELVPIITHLANLCFTKGVFPTALKRSIITPVYKSGDKTEVSNYRPISVLPALSKIVEKLMNSRLINYMNNFNILSSSQFGFRRGRSTEDAVIGLSSLISEHLDAGKKCVSVFLDIKKAFDTVSIPVLLYKLQKIGVRGVALDLFRDYLHNREQVVKVDQYISERVGVSFGVPQGSVLGPTLFLVYVNDLCDMNISKAKIFSYADDTAIVFEGATWNEVKVNVETGLIQVAKWLTGNLLTLNTSKTDYICFGIDKRSQPDINYTIKIHSCRFYSNGLPCNCPAINRANHVKYLGVMIDQRLTWYPHLEHVVNRIRKLSWIFKSLRHVVPKNINPHNPNNNLLNYVYISLVQSILIYCISVWGGAAKTRFLDLERAQRALIKIMYFKERRFPTETLYKECNLLTIRKLYILHSVLKKHKTLTFDPSIQTRRRRAVIIETTKCRTKFAHMQYMIKSAFLYNKVNKGIYIYDKNLFECKKLITDWLKTKTYTETEELLK